MRTFISRSANEKINKIVNDGINNLAIISDFDRTLTKSFIYGKYQGTTFSLISLSRILPEAFINKTRILFNKYRPIEINNSLDFNTKFKFMEEWWSETQSLLIKYKFSKDKIRFIVNQFPNIFKEDFENFINIIGFFKIPFLIFSAGVGDLIKAYLCHYGYDNIFIVSNFFEFDEKGIAIRNKPPIIHSMNKSLEVIKNKKFLNSINKPNIILLGDSIGDIKMVNFKDINVLRIAFLSPDNEDLDTFKEYYDIVIANYESLKVVVNILRKILGQ